VDMEYDDDPPSRPGRALSNHKPHPPTPPRQRTISSEAFAQRAPASPMPAPSPRKPRPPARTRSSATSTVSKPPEPRDLAEENDPLQLGPDSSEMDSPTARKPARSTRVVESTSETASSSTTRRSKGKQKTLDEELKIARHAENPDDEDLESGFFVGVGTRSKRRGYHAHGGAGGSPVFMGVGYVEGAQERDTDEEDVTRDSDANDPSYKPKRRGQKSKTSGKRSGARR
jgi:hypothetical protein